MARSSSRRTDTSITKGSFYHDTAKLPAIPPILTWDITRILIANPA